MTDQRHPDIEIYVKNRSLNEIEAWLRQRFDGLSNDFSQGTVHEYKASLDGTAVPVMIHEKVVGKAWTSVWFKSDRTRWEKDLDCAIQAAADMETQIRCIAGGWADGDEPDEWWKVENDSQEKIHWRTE